MMKNMHKKTILMFVLGMKMIEGSLEVKLPTIWTDEKHSQEEAQA